MWLILYTLLVAQPVGELTSKELRSVEALSFERDLSLFIKSENSKRRDMQWKQTFSPYDTFPLLGITALTTTLAVKTPRTSSRCRRTLRRLVFGAGGVASGGLLLKTLYGIWVLPGSDPETEWLKIRQDRFRTRALLHRENQLIHLFKAALRRDFGDEADISVAFSNPSEIWSALPERAWVDGRIYRSEYEWVGNQWELKYFRWVLK